MRPFPITAVVCVKNGGKTIERTLLSIKSNNVEQIIVVDGLSTDDTLDIARKYADKILSDEGKGLAYARQIGAENASSEFVAFVDADAVLPRNDTLLSMLTEMLSNRWVAIHSQLVDPRNDKSYWEEGEDFHWDKYFNNPGERRYLGTVICIIKRELILKFRFDPIFTKAAEDADFFHRLGQMGHKFGVSQTVGYHYHRSTIKEFMRQRINYGKENMKAMRKHRAPTLLFAPLAIAASGFLISIRCKKPKFLFFYAVWGISLAIGSLNGLLCARQSER